MARAARAGTTHKTTKGYPRLTAGPLRNQYVHRVVAAAWVGRPLRRDEEVHHRDGNKLNPAHTNLLILGSSDHGWVSAKQAWYMKSLDIRAKAEWDEFMELEADRQQTEIRQAKASGQPWESCDGSLQQAWDTRWDMTQGPQEPQEPPL